MLTPNGVNKRQLISNKMLDIFERKLHLQSKYLVFKIAFKMKTKNYKNVIAYT